MFGRNDKDARATTDATPAATNVPGADAAPAPSPVHSEDRVVTDPQQPIVAATRPGSAPEERRESQTMPQGGEPEVPEERRESQAMPQGGEPEVPEERRESQAMPRGTEDRVRDDRTVVGAAGTDGSGRVIERETFEPDATHEPTQVLTDRDRGSGPSTQPQPAVVDETPTQTVVTEPVPAVTERDREAEREARQRALGVRTRTEDTGDYVAPVQPKRTTDRWHGSLALTILRLITAAILGIRAWQHVMHLTRTQDYYSHSILPSFHYLGWTVVIIEAVIAVLLLLGILTRFAGLLLLAFEVATLVLFVWGKVNPFNDARVGFNGELELLLAAVGLLFLLLGSGGWGFDAAFRRSRAAAKEEKAMGNTV